MTRKIILNLAISLDGFIADSEGSFAWIKGDGDTSYDTKKKFNFEAFMNTVDIVVMGKLAFLDCPKETLDTFKDKAIYVATNGELETEYTNVKFIKGDIVSQITTLQKEDGKDIWLFGGAGLTDFFIKADVIDEYVIGYIPIILGKGRPLFLKDNPTLDLHLEEVTSQEGIVIMIYTRRS
ncbi:MAG: dihydrofolate reductase [Candidatus Woesearchaeota archaeon]|jgi:dihydrofolate reductase